jgi:hypothetical protein
VPHRIKKSLTDLDGTDPRIHGGVPEGVLRELSNALSRDRHRPTLVELGKIYVDLTRVAAAEKRAGADLFGASAFGDLVIAGQQSARRRIASLRVGSA